MMADECFRICLWIGTVGYFNFVCAIHIDLKFLISTYDNRDHATLVKVHLVVVIMVVIISQEYVIRRRTTIVSN